MPELTLIEPRAGEVIGDAPDRRVEILGDLDRVHATLSRFAPAREGADLHIHRRHVEAFHVLDGELVVTTGEGELRAPAGSWLQVPQGTVHAVASSEPVRYLNVQAPSRGFGTANLDQEPA